MGFLSTRLTFISILAWVILLPQVYSQQTGTAISTDGTAIYYRTFGSGKPLLIINGGPGMNSDGFESLAVSFSQNYRAIIYDQRGTGRSVLNKIDSTTVTMKHMLEDIEGIRKQLGIDTWSILGHSFGGMLASAYAAEYPRHIDKMTLSSSGGIDLGLLNYARVSIDSKLTKADLDSVAYWAAKIEAGDTSHHARLERGRHLAPAYVIDPRFIPIIAERLTQGNGAINQLMWDDLRRIHFDCAEKLKSFDRPVLIIQGREDIIRPETAEAAHKVLQQSRVVYMDHCGHYGWLDNPKVYFEETTAFLTGA